MVILAIFYIEYISISVPAPNASPTDNAIHAPFGAQAYVSRVHKIRRVEITVFWVLLGLMK